MGYAGENVASIRTPFNHTALATYSNVHKTTPVMRAPPLIITLDAVPGVSAVDGFTYTCMRAGVHILIEKFGQVYNRFSLGFKF